MSNAPVAVTMGTMVLLGGLLYFVPTFVAVARKHTNATSIFLLDLLLAWTGFGWIAALVWSVSAVEKPSPEPVKAKWLEPKPFPTKPPADDTKDCPFCAETIKAKAVVCRFCGKELPKVADHPDSPQPDRITGYIPVSEFGVTDSNAKRIGATEVNRSYNDARLNSVSHVRDATGADVGVLHISSLLPTTRADHEARHGNAYTPEQQTQWWNTGVNRINCHCTTRTVVFKDGQVVEAELQKRVRDARNEK